MLESFQNHINTEFSALKNSKLLLAISGGLDSVVLAHLCKKAGLDFSMAHCNFNLRAEESDEDEAYVKELAQELDAKIYIENFNTKKYAEEEKLSIQLAARNLRYNWFYELKQSYGFNFVLTAHHANDDLETFLINFTRGTGLDGLTGIPKENNFILRPLLAFSRNQIENFAKENNLKWREDSSNRSIKYIRNKIRHHVIPELEEMNPNLINSFLQTQHNLMQSAALLKDYTALLFKEIVSKKADSYLFSIAKIASVPNPKAVIYQLLNGFGFTAWEDIYNLLQAQPGKMVFSKTHRLVKDREYLVLTSFTSENKEESNEYYIHKGTTSVQFPLGTIYIEEVEKMDEIATNIAYIDKEKLQFPLKLRKWEAGDSFYPFGMKGTKKLSDFFADKKLSLPEKEMVWILFSDNQIVWILNHRADNRFKVDESTQSIIKITCT